MHMCTNKQHFKVFQLPPAPLWYLLSWDTFNIPCSLLFIIDLLSSIFSQKLHMKILTNTRIKKPVSCMIPGFEKKMYSGKDNVVGKEQTSPSSWLKGLLPPSSSADAWLPSCCVSCLCMRGTKLVSSSMNLINKSQIKAQISVLYWLSLCSALFTENVSSPPALSQIM